MNQLHVNRWRAALACVVLATTAFSGCDSRDPYRMGIVLGVDGLHGARLAAAEVNAHGGIRGAPIVLREMNGDAFGGAALALAQAESLAGDDAVLAVVGHTNSSASLVAAQVYNAAGIVQIAPTSSSPAFADAGPFSFRLVPSDVYQGAFLAEQVTGRATLPRVALVAVNDDYGRALRRVTLERLHAGGVMPVYDAPYAEGQQTLSDTEIVLGLRHARPDLLIWIGRAYDFLAIARPLRRALPSLEVLASDGFGGPTLDSDPDHLLDGVQYVLSVNLSDPDSAMQRFRREYERAGERRLTEQAVFSYDAVMLLADAMRHVGRNRHAIRDWLAQLGSGTPPFRGLSGAIAFSGDRPRSPAYFLQRIGDPRDTATRTVHGGTPGRSRP